MRGRPSGQGLDSSFVEVLARCQRARAVDRAVGAVQSAKVIRARRARAAQSVASRGFLQMTEIVDADVARESAERRQRIVRESGEDSLYNFWLC